MAQARRANSIATIRKLLLAAFTAEDLRRFCQDRPRFRPIIDRFGPGHGFDDMVDEVVDYCETHLLFNELLAEVEKANPNQYAEFEPALQDLEVGPDSHEPAADRFTQCEQDLKVLGQQLGTPHPGHDAYTRLGDDLRSNIAQAREKDDQEIQARRRLILQALNRLALNTVKQSFGEDGLSPAPSWIVTVMANLVFVGVVGLVLSLVLRQKLGEWLPCRCSWTLFFGLPVIILSSLHIGWRRRCSQPRYVDGKIEVDLKFVRKELDIAPGIDALHFWTTSDRLSYVAALVAMVGAVLLFLLVPGPPEATPIVESYTVRYVPSGETVQLTPVEAAEQGIAIPAGDSALITTNVVGSANVHCTWQAMKGGKLKPEQGCAARYTPPLGDSDDVISILIESQCRTCEWWSTVPVTIRHP